MVSQNKVNARLIILVSVLVMGVALLSGCDTKKTTASSQQGTQNYHLSQPTTTPASFSQGGTTVVEVTVTNNASAHVAGVSVSFEVSPSNSGYFTPPTAITDTDGVASSVFTSTSYGSLSIRAAVDTLHSAYSSVTVAATGQQTNGNLTMQIAPGLIAADDTSTATVTVSVNDGNNNPAPNGTVVKFAAGERFKDNDGNGYFTMGIDSVLFDYNGNEQWDAIGVIPATATTTNGTVTVDYQAGTAATTAYLKATVTGSGNFNGSVEASLQLTPNASIYSIALGSDAPGVQVQGTGGTETTNLKAICYDVNGNRVPEGVKVIFYIINGPSGGENLAGKGWGPDTVLTNSLGEASVPFWSGTISGTVRVRASAGTVLSNATFVTVYAGPPYYISVGAKNCNIAGWHIVNMNNDIVALVGDIYHNPVQDSVVVYFTSDEGIVSAYGLTANHSGLATGTFYSGAPWGNGRVWVIAETSGGTVKDSTLFWNTGVPVYLSVSPTTLPSVYADAKTQRTFYTEVTDINDNYVVNGTTVEAKAVYGGASAQSTEDGCYHSTSKGTYTAPLLTRDFSVTGANDDGIGGIDVVTISCGWVNVAVVCSLKTDVADPDQSSIKVGSTFKYGDANLPIQVLIKDGYGNPLADHTLVASITVGSIVGGTGTQESNALGKAVGFRFNSPAAPPPDTTGAIPATSGVIMVLDTDPRGAGLLFSAPVTFTK